MWLLTSPFFVARLCSVSPVLRFLPVSVYYYYYYYYYYYNTQRPRERHASDWRKVHFCFTFRAEQELLLRRSVALAHGEDYKLTGRRSFFRRSKKGTHGVAVNHSREGSDSATSITTSCPGLSCLCVYEPLSGGEGNGALSFLFPTPLWILLPSQAQCGNFSMDYKKKRLT